MKDPDPILGITKIPTNTIPFTIQSIGNHYIIIVNDSIELVHSTNGVDWTNCKLFHDY